MVRGLQLPLSVVLNALLVGGIVAGVVGCPNGSPAPGPDPSLAGCNWGADETGGDGLEGLDAFSESAEFQAYMDEFVIPQPDGGWEVEGDIFVQDLDLVVAAYRRSLSNQELQNEDEFRSTVACNFLLDIDEIWSPSQKLALTYCFDTSWDDVPIYRNITVEALDIATLAWESAADVNFIALRDGNTCSHENGALFVVQYGGLCNGDQCGYRARAFFPNTNEASRILTFWAPAYSGPGNDINRTATHELGHILGLFHEQARYLQDDLTCSLTSGLPFLWRGLTAPDPDSVMGYIQCNGTEPQPPHPSALDRAGLAYLYNLPRPISSGAMTPLDPGTLAWHRPVEGEFLVWNSIQEPNDPIAFNEIAGCYYPDCAPGAAPHWKPILVNNANSVSLLMYGPGQFEERRFSNLGGQMISDIPGSLGSTVDVPVLLDQFFGGEDRSVWWIRPGQVNDKIWRGVSGQTSSSYEFDDRPFTDEHYSATAGRLFGSYSSVFWLSPTTPHAYLTYSFDGTAMQQIGVDKEVCGLAESVSYNAVPGDFDGDGLDEIVWHDHDTGLATYWPQLPACGQHSSFAVGQGKLAAFRVSGKRDSLLVYKPQEEGVELYDVLLGSAVAVLPIEGDTAPLLRDFNGDGCSDILWFAPHLPTSRLWQSNCDTTFNETALLHPPSAYPLGYGLGHGR